MADSVEQIPTLEPMRQVSYRESFARRMNGSTSPLLPIDADIAVHARELEDMAQAQRNARERPIDDSVER